jgi:hypothetical protein
VTTILAIWGAVLSTALALVALLSYLRDRPKPFITSHTDQRRGQPPELGLDVANRGRQTTTLMEVGFFVDVQTTVRLADGSPEIPVRPKITMAGTPGVVAPGEVVQFRKQLVDWPGVVHADDPLRAYAVDSHGCTSWGSAMPLLRLIVQHGWWPRTIADPRLLEPLPGPKIARAVEPRWKLWVPRSLRTPTDVSIVGMINGRRRAQDGRDVQRAPRW